MKKIVGFYHRGDLDGISSAAILKDRFSKEQLILVGVEFGDNLGDMNEIVKDADSVYMVDFVFEPFERMIELNKTCNLFWIDHHASSLKYVEKYPEIKFKGLLGNKDNKKSAAYLLWEYFYQNAIVPRGINFISLFDTWQHNFDDNILSFYYGVEAKTGMNPHSDVWEDILLNTINTDTMIDIGKSVRSYVKMKDAAYAFDHAFEADFEGYKAIVINIGFPGSMKFDSVIDNDKHDIMIGFSRRKGKFWKFSLYTTKKHIDCSKIAGKYGGGGHAGAAGFELDYIPFKI